MNFALKPLDLRRLSSEKTDVLLVFLTTAFKPEKDVLSNWIAKVMKSGDLTPQAGQVLDIFRPDGLACSRLVLLHVGEGAVADVRKAVLAAEGLIKSTKPKALTLGFLQMPTAQALRVAVTTLADATYVYTATKS